MEAQRKIAVRLDTMSPRHFLCIYVLAACLLATSLGIGSAGPAINNSGLAASGVAMYRPTGGSSFVSTCVLNPSGGSVTITRCWDWTFNVNSRLTQFYQLTATPHSGGGTGSDSITLHIQWWGRHAGAASYDLIADSNVTRALKCPSDGGACSVLPLIRTSTVQYSTYVIRVSFPPETPSTAYPYLGTFDFAYSYRNPDFSLFEMGFKYTWFSIAVILASMYIGINACDWPCCGRIEWLLLCCKRGVLPFQRQEGVTWLYAMQWGLVLFNEPFLGLTYYAPAPTITLINVAMQLTFIALLLAYWLVEFGFLKSNPQNAASISFCRFYAPKLAAIFLYWILALAMYGYVLFKMQSDPVYDWVTEVAATRFLQVWGGAVAAAYIVYLAWLLCRSLTTIKSWNHAERFLFGFHLSIFVATALGVAGGYVYGVSLTDGLSFMFFNALYNMYVPTLTYLYTPVLYEPLATSDVAASATQRDDSDELESGDAVVGTQQPRAPASPDVLATGMSAGVFAIEDDDDDAALERKGAPVKLVDRDALVSQLVAEHREHHHDDARSEDSGIDDAAITVALGAGAASTSVAAPPDRSHAPAAVDADAEGLEEAVVTVLEDDEPVPAANVHAVARPS